MLAAGAIGTPKLLGNVGHRPARVLRAHGLDVRHDLPEPVGENLTDHLQIRTVFRISGARTLNDLYASPFGKLRIAADYRAAPPRPDGDGAEPAWHLHPLRAGHERPDIEYHVQPLSLDRSASRCTGFPAWTVSVATCARKAGGVVISAAPIRRHRTVIRPNYLSAEADVRSPSPASATRAA